MNQKSHDLLRKITYIEADIEIQKQILFSISVNDESEMERVIKIIAAKKEEISALRLEIQKIDPEVHDKINALENAVSALKKLASEKKFKSIEGMNNAGECCISLKNGSRIQYLVKACAEDGEVTIITLDGDIKHFPSKDVEDAPLAFQAGQ